MNPRNTRICQFQKILSLFILFMTVALILTLPGICVAGTWTNCGAIEGGGQLSFVIDPQNSNNLYAAMLDSSVFRSTNGGESWNEANTGLGTFKVSKLWIDPQNPATLYALTYSNGIFKSTNRGQSWSEKNNGLPSTYVHAFAINRQNPLTLYAATYVVGNGGNGIYKSTNGGESWNARNTGLPLEEVQILQVDPNRPESVFAAVYRSGIYRSTDAGGNWSASNTGLPATDIQQLVVDPHHAATVYVVTYDSSIQYPDSPYALYKSTNGGEGWNAVDFGLQSYGAVIPLFDPQDPSTMYTSGSGGIYKSTDGGDTWNLAFTPPTNIGFNAIDPLDSSILYGTSYTGGVYKSTDSGTNWTAMNSGLTGTSIQALSVNPGNPQIVYAGTRHRIFKSTDGCAHWRLLSNETTAADDILTFSFDPQNPEIMYAGTRDSGAGLYKSTDAGDSWEDIDKWLYAQVRSIAVHPQDSAIMYLGKDTGNNPFSKSTNGGESWFGINQGFPEPIGILRVFALAIDPQDPENIYAGTDDGIYTSSNGGMDWTHWPTGTGFGEVRALLLHPDTPSTLFAGTDSGAFKSTDGGSHWSSISTGLTATDIVSLVFDPQQPDILYAGTRENGVYESTNGGDSWSSINSGLSNTYIRALAIAPGTQMPYAAVNGGKVFKYSSAPMSAITITTDPAGRSILVDGTTYTAPQTFSWEQASSHTIAVTSPQGSDGTRYVFANWSDGGAISHSITVPASDTTYTASFTTQYQLAASLSPEAGGTVSLSPESEDGYYDSDTAVQLTANPNIGYFFSYWSGDLTGSDATQTVTMSAPRTVIANFMQQGSSVGLNLTDGGAASYRSSGSADTTSVGFADIAVNSGDSPYGTAVFSFKQDGITVTEAGVPASPPTTHARIFIDYRIDVNAIPGRDDAGKIDVNTGICVVNYSDETAAVTYTLRSIDGTLITSGTGTIAPRNHFSRFIDQFGEIATGFELPDNFLTETRFASLEISSDQLLSILALRMTANQRDKILYTTTPVADLAQPLSTDPVYFAQFADGGGYAASLILLNTSDALETGTLQLLDNDGAPLNITPVGGTTASSFHYSILAGGVYLLRTDGSPVDAKIGWVRLTPDEGTSTPVGSGVFDYNPGNVLQSESGVPAALATTHARVYVDLSGNHNTGLAIANLESTPAEITINAFEKDGVTTAGTNTGPLELVANGHKAKFADELISGLPAGFTGVLDVSSTTPFAALTIRSLNNEDDKFLMTTFPVADVTRPAPSPIVFPQIADGGGYRSEFILISPTGEASSTLSFFDESGNPMELGD